MNARTSASGRALSTWRGSTQPRRAVPIPMLHLPVEPSRPMAVAVDRQRDAGPDRRTRMLAVEVDVRGRAVHLQRRSGLRGGRVDGVEIQRISRAASDDVVGRVREDRDERVPDSLDGAAGQRPRVMVRRVVQRGQDDIQRLERGVGEIEPAVRHDVGLDAVQDRDLRIAFAHRGNLVPLARKVAARAASGRAAARSE